MKGPSATDARNNGSQSNVNASLTPAQARQKVLVAVVAAMLDAFSFDEDSTLVMDYACGTGALSQRLAPYSKSIIGVDIDEDAVQQYNAKVINQGIPLDEMHAICVDLHHDQGELQGRRFDVIVCSQAYHHFPSIDETTALLSSFLKPQGMLLVSDLLKGSHADEFRNPGPSSHSHHHHPHDVVHKGGLTENEIQTSFERAGLTDIEFEVIETVSRNGRDIDIFLSQGMRSAE